MLLVGLIFYWPYCNGAKCMLLIRVAVIRKILLGQIKRKISSNDHNINIVLSNSFRCFVTKALSMKAGKSGLILQVVIRYYMLTRSLLGLYFYFV